MMLIDDAEWMKILPKNYVHRNWTKVRELGVRSDIVRASLLSHFGGVYLDADTICFKHPKEKFMSEKFLYSTWTRPPLRCIAGYVSAPKLCPVALCWHNNIKDILEEDLSKVKWCALGEGCLTPAIQNWNQFTKKVHLSTFLPIEIDNNVQEFFRDGDYRNYITDHTFCFGLNNSWFASRMPAELNSPFNKGTILHGLLRYAEQL